MQIRQAPEASAPPQLDKPIETLSGTSVHIAPPITVKRMAAKLGLKPHQIIQELMLVDIFVQADEAIPAEVAATVAAKHGFILKDRPVSAVGELEHRCFPPHRPAETASRRELTLGEVLCELNATILVFLRAADALASALSAQAELDWSPAVIALCKAFELETVDRILLPLRLKSAGLDLRNDIPDKDLGRVTKYCSSPTARPPELGTLGRFLSTAIHSRERRKSSVQIRTFYEVVSLWPRSRWIVDKEGLPAGLERLTTDFRNRAAHIERMTEEEFHGCSAFLRERPQELIIKLFVATDAAA